MDITFRSVHVEIVAEVIEFFACSVVAVNAISLLQKSSKDNGYHWHVAHKGK